jgi:FKBP-type peptidyl-prolyl cis-trans isomerase 2
MGDKKQKEAATKKIKQVLVVGACVLFVVLMVLSGMGSSWLNVFTVIKPGDTVVVDYTFYDTTGNAVLTSSQQAYMAAAEKGREPLYARQLAIVTGQNLTKSIYPVPFYSGSSGWTNQYALFALEYDAINQALVGMRKGDRKSVQIPSRSMAQEWSAEQLTRNGVDIGDLNTGDILAMGVSDNPEETATNTSITYTRVGQVTSRTNESVIVDFGYPSADISIVSINTNR